MPVCNVNRTTVFKLKYLKALYQINERLFERFNPLSARVFTVFGHSLLEDRVLHKEAWVAKLLGTHLSIQVHKKVKFSRRDNSSLAVKGLKASIIYFIHTLKNNVDSQFVFEGGFIFCLTLTNYSIYLSIISKLP